MYLYRVSTFEYESLYTRKSNQRQIFATNTKTYVKEVKSNGNKLNKYLTNNKILALTQISCCIKQKVLAEWIKHTYSNSLKAQAK